ncbi:MAG: NAD(P)-dependent alcohol dehydrogenase [Deltaproteobacteria bacterium]|nr:NAD(P)-dependent alcohol dehydrogenase [Deltaproteobacteria bacterium]
MAIRAMAAMEQGGALAPWSYEPDALGPMDVRVRVKSCGICFSDVHMIDNDWGASRYPLVPGHEAVGVVEELGGGVTHLKLGDRVGVGWQRGACLQCSDCLRGDENLCAENRATIIHGRGGFAEALVIDSRFAFRLPEGLDTTTAGPLLCGGVTVYSALRHAGMRSGQNVGVIGVGGLGHLAVQFAAKLGNRVTVFTTSDDKAELASRLGAHEAVVTRAGEEPSCSRDLDVLISTVPVALDFAAYLDLLGSDATMTFVGVPNEPMSVPLVKLLARRRRITASPIGGRAMMDEMLRTADTFGIAPIVETFPLAAAGDAIAKVRANAVRYRAVLTV